MKPKCTINSDGTKAWYLNGKLHREDGPAIEWPDGSKQWYLNGKEYIEKDWKKAVAKLKKGDRQLPNLSKINLDLDLPPKKDSTDPSSPNYPNFGGEDSAWPKKHPNLGEGNAYAYMLKFKDGRREFYNKTNQLHHTAGPALRSPTGHVFYFLNGVEYSKPRWTAAVQKLNADAINKAIDENAPPLEESAPRTTFKRYVAKTRKV